MNPVAEKLGELGLPSPVAALAARDWDAVVVGGGHNGLAAAAYLARAGKSVLVLERRERVGGAATLERPFSDERYIVSPCAYVAGLLDPLVISELGLHERGISIRIADPALFIPFDDGTALVDWADRERTAAGMRELGISEQDIQGYREYDELFDRCRRLLRKGDRDTWVGDSPSRAEIEEILGGERELIDILFNASIADVLDDCVSDQRLKDALYGQGLIGTWGGPKTPGTAAIHLMHHSGELNGKGGAWGYVEGGLGMISFAIADAALDAGAEIACGIPVAAVHPGEGVELEDGTRIRARAIVSNADPKVVLRLLNGNGIPSDFEARLREWKVRSPVLKVNAALSELPRWTASGGETWPAAGTVNCRESLDDAQAAFEAAERGELSVGFTEVYSQTAADPSVAPPGCHVISVFCQYAPADKDVAEWDAGLRDQAAEQVFGLIERFAPGFREQVLEHEVLGPPDIE
ncbi:MAG TPA: NAD(P)/FAD-dependent oxidoreductase, partial [Solirubrobacteraceae bacterium]|nr:NAD(P)/FAD-dependent oxidoreductase [Solirubrobacteraceae bacterium]